jgi:hypothetical protein
VYVRGLGGNPSLLLPGLKEQTKTEYSLASPLPTILEIGFPNLLGAKK